MKTGIEIVKKIMAQEKFAGSRMARSLGITRQSVYISLEQQDIPTNRCLEMLAIMGYRVSIEKVPYARMSLQQLEDVMAKQKPKGLFWGEDEGKYLVVDNRTGNASTNEFDSEEKCIEYLEMMN